MPKTVQPNSLSDYKSVNYQALGVLLADHVGQGDIMVHCGVSPETARQILKGNCSPDPRLSIATGLVLLAKTKDLEIPVND